MSSFDFNPQTSGIVLTAWQLYKDKDYDAAISLLKLQMPRRIESASVLLARCYEESNKKDEAIPILKQTAQKGHPGACIQLGKYYFGCKKYGKSYKYFEQATRDGKHSEAYYHMGLLIRDTKEFPLEKEQGLHMHMFQKAALADHPGALFEVASNAKQRANSMQECEVEESIDNTENDNSEEDKDEDKEEKRNELSKYAIRTFKKAAKCGSANAKIELTNYYHNKWNDGHRYAKGCNAKKWYESVLNDADFEDVNNTIAYNLAILKESMFKYNMHDDSGRDDFIKLADKGDDEACLKLYYIYKNQPENPTAMQYLQKAVLLNNAEARYVSGMHYLEGTMGKTKNVSRGVNYLHEAASQGYADAMNQLAFSMMCGVGQSGRTTNALEWLTKAANKGNIDAHVNLGKYYYKKKYSNNGVSFGQALYWFHKALQLDSDNSVAAYYIGECHFFGRGTLCNFAQAKYWFKRSGKKRAEKLSKYCEFAMDMRYDDQVQGDFSENAKKRKAAHTHNNACKRQRL